ncbi:hypothetical protein D1AOALGA4SA_908 [Olavius algarvensis Delta 1 endosymbiont]|nr:hypothetical protein D1AOALGA4SA_908 [Olavius algarvensis Delta 1 endosymbiont]
MIVSIKRTNCQEIQRSDCLKENYPDYQNYENYKHQKTNFK